MRHVGIGFIIIVVFTIILMKKFFEKRKNHNNWVAKFLFFILIFFINIITYSFSIGVAKNSINLIYSSRYEATVVGYEEDLYQDTSESRDSNGEVTRNTYKYTVYVPKVKYIDEDGKVIKNITSRGYEEKVEVGTKMTVMNDLFSNKLIELSEKKIIILIGIYLALAFLVSLSSYIALRIFEVEKKKSRIIVAVIGVLIFASTMYIGIVYR